MKIETNIKNKTENTNEKLSATIEENQILSATNLPFSEFIRLNEEVEISSESISILNSMPVDYNYDSMFMNINDAMFFVNLTQEGQFTVETTPSGDFKDLIQIQTAQTAVTQKNVDTTNLLTQLIEKSFKTQKPVRISFDNDVSVILKIDKDGKLTAEFIPGSAEVENYLKNNISSLKQKFDEQNLPYNDLFYRQNNRQNGNKEKRNKNKGEQ